MFDHNGERTQLKVGDVLSFVYGPLSATVFRVVRVSPDGERWRLLKSDGTPLFSPRFFDFNDCGELAALIADVCGFDVVSGKIEEKDDVRTAEFEVCARR